jgi:hypothetical protein
MIGRANSVLGIQALVAGDRTTAREHFEIAAVKYDEAGDLYSRGNTLGNLAAAAVLDDDLPSATLALAESLETWDPSSNPFQLGHVLVIAAATAVGQDDPEMAARLLGGSRALFERLGFSLEPLEAGIERETRTLVQTELGAARYEEELARGAEADPAEQLELVKHSLQRWAGSKAV